MAQKPVSGFRKIVHFNWRLYLNLAVLCHLAYGLTNDQIKTIEKKQFLYDYFETSAEGLINRDYVALETNPKTHLMCPKDYYISRLFYRFISSEEQRQRLNIKDQAFLYTVEDAVKLEKDVSDRTKDMCPTLMLCLGYQACLFKYSNEFCKNDPMPRFRKTINIYLTCTLISSIENLISSGNFKPSEISEIHKRKESIMFITHSSFIEQGVRNYEEIDIYQHVIPKKSVFGVTCPQPQEAYKQGFRGECGGNVPSVAAVVRKMWHILSRVPGSECREELTHVYCAFKLNSTGGCFPPEHVQSNLGAKEISFNFPVLPAAGPRPDVTRFNLIRRSPHAALIPARLGFIILIHNNPKLCMKLLLLIHRPHHHYVIHVDSRKGDVRRELQQLVEKKFRGFNNIRILPEDRSFLTSWASYAYIRAHLECLEELLRMGLWDFTINLSSADLPLRSVDDLAESLGGYRGTTFYNTFTVHELRGDPLWYSCGGYVYQVASKGPYPRGHLHHQSVWTVFSRDFSAYLVNSTARSDVNSLQLYLQTVRTCDEYYFSNILQSSRLKKTYYHHISTHVRDNQNRNIDNLCRHLGDDADFCGQGPGMFVPQDIPDLRHLSYSRFFARKFSLDPKDSVRQAVLGWSKDGIYREMEEEVGVGLIRSLASLSISTSPLTRDLELLDVVRWQVLPQWKVRDRCCMRPYQVLNGYNEVLYQLLFTAKGTQGRPVYGRASVFPGATMLCFGPGHLRGLSVSVSGEGMDMANKLNPHRITVVQAVDEKWKKIYVNFYMDAMGGGKLCEKHSAPAKDRVYVEYGNMVRGKAADELEVFVDIIKPGGEVACAKRVRVPYEEGGVIKDRFGWKSAYLHRETITCEEPLLERVLYGGGVWRVRVRAVAGEGEDDRRYVYTYPLYILHNKEKINIPQETLSELFHIEDVMLLGEEEDFYGDEWAHYKQLLPELDMQEQQQVVEMLKMRQDRRQDVAEDTSKSGEDTSKSGEETSKSPEETSKSGEETSKSGEETSKSGEETSKSGEETSKSGVEKDHMRAKLSKEEVNEGDGEVSGSEGQDRGETYCFDTILPQVVVVGVIGTSTFILSTCAARLFPSTFAIYSHHQLLLLRISLLLQLLLVCFSCRHNILNGTYNLYENAARL